LTKEEKNALPLELKACFYIQGWNVSANINSVDDWAMKFWAMWDHGDEHFPKSSHVCRSEMKARVQSLIEFVEWAGVPGIKGNPKMTIERLGD